MSFDFQTTIERDAGGYSQTLQKTFKSKWSSVTKFHFYKTFSKYFFSIHRLPYNLKTGKITTKKKNCIQFGTLPQTNLYLKYKGNIPEKLKVKPIHKIWWI